MPTTTPKRRAPRTAFKKGQVPWNKGKKHSEETKAKLKVARKGRIFSEATKLKMSKSHKGLNTWIKGTKRPHTEETKRKIGLAHRGKPLFKNRGANNPNWKGGVTPTHNQVRGSIEYRIWSHSVMSKDNFTCKKTGVRGGKLVVHHVLNFSSHPELRFAIDNGITLSKEAHEEFHRIYGKKNNTREQLEEYLKK